MPRSNTVRVESRFPGRAPQGSLFTNGLHAKGKPELYITDVPREHKPRVKAHVEFLVNRTVLAGEVTGIGEIPFVVKAKDSDDTQELLSTTMSACSPHASILELCKVDPVASYEDDAECDLHLSQMAEGLKMQGGCSRGTEGCMSEPSALYRAVKGEEAFTGIVVKKEGFIKLDAASRDLNAPGHLMTSGEWRLDMSVYDGASSTVIPYTSAKFVHRDGLEDDVEVARAQIKPILDRAIASGFPSEAVPTEVRRGDTALLFFSGVGCCDSPTCQRRCKLVEVLAVHHNGLGIVVDDDSGWPLRIQLNAVHGAIRGEHW